MALRKIGGAVRHLREAVLVVLLALGACAPGGATTWHVDVSGGRDENTGASAEAPFKTIQQACDRVNPGDTVVVAPGVYFENIQLKRVGTAEQPILFQADAVGRKRVVITGALPEIRQGKAAWKLEDEALRLYSAPCDRMPARILYDDVDLFPYPNLDSLKKFLIGADNPGPRHGYAFDAASGKLYVRLYQPHYTRLFKPSGVYGAQRFPSSPDLGLYGLTDPNAHTLCVSPRFAGGGKGEYIDRPDCYNWGILSEGPAHVILDGFTFETPAVTGVYVRGSDVTVRNCWFLGCKAGVTGGPRTDNDTWSGSANVVVEYCDFTQYPSFADVEETIARSADDPQIKENRYFWWARKGEFSNRGTPAKLSYETGGIILGMGKGWKLRHCYIHEVFDGLSAAQGGSEGLEISHNRFERVIDNAIQTEDHGKNWRIHDNEFVDCYMPISWQPLAGTPWPGPVFLYRNLIYDTRPTAAMWRQAGWPGAWLKCGVSPKNWGWPKHMKDVPKDQATVPGAGFVIFNNTIALHDGYFLERCSGQPIHLRNFKFYNNIFITQPLFGEQVLPADTAADWEFAHNLYAPPQPVKTPAGAVLAGNGGKAFTNPERLGLADLPEHRFELQRGSPAIGGGVPIPGEPETFSDIGAIPYGTEWVSPQVGPRVNSR